jgi:hypothetical protein
MQESFTPLFSCLDSISLRPSQVGFAITETHHHSLGFPYFNNSARLFDFYSPDLIGVGRKQRERRSQRTWLYTLHPLRFF